MRNAVEREINTAYLNVFVHSCVFGGTRLE